MIYHSRSDLYRSHLSTRALRRKREAAAIKAKVILSKLTSQFTQLSQQFKKAQHSRAIGATWQTSRQDFPLSSQNFHLATQGNQSRARTQLHFWRKAGAPAKVLRWILHGVNLPFHTEPRPYAASSPPWAPQERRYWKEQLCPKLLKDGAIR